MDFRKDFFAREMFCWWPRPCSKENEIHTSGPKAHDADLPRDVQRAGKVHGDLSRERVTREDLQLLDALAVSCARFVVGATLEHGVYISTQHVLLKVCAKSQKK